MPAHPMAVNQFFWHVNSSLFPFKIIGSGSCSTTGGANGWLCQHRFVAITGMVGFRNNVGSATLNNWVSPQSQQIAFGRGSLGYVAINNANSQWSSTFTTSLPDGTYCDVIRGTVSNGRCSGPSWVFSVCSKSVRTQLIGLQKLYCFRRKVHGNGACEGCYCHPYWSKRINTIRCR